MTDNLPLDGAALPLDEAAIKQRFHDAPLLALEEIHEMLDQCRAALALRARVAELEHDEATLLEDNDLLKTHANVLRDALEDVLLNRDCACYEDGEPNCCDVCAARYADAAKSIATTPRANLAEYRKSVLEEAAAAIREACPKAHTYASENADIYLAQDHAVDGAIAAIRALAAQEVK